MSKYFEATLRARNLQPAVMAEPSNGAHPSAVTEIESAEAVPAIPVPETRPNCAPASKVAIERNVCVPFDKVPQLQFGKGNSLGAVEESYRGLRTRLLRLRSALGLRSVVITSAVQGEGKTLTSLNLALCCAQLNDMRILLVDSDIRSAGLSKKLALPEENGLSDVLSGRCKPEEAVFSTDVPNLYVLGAGAGSAAPAELFADHRWSDFLSWCHKGYGLVLVDSPPVLNLSDVELITAGCDGVLMIVRALMTNRQTLEKCAGQIDSKKLLGLIYNGTDSSTRSGYEYGTEGPRKGPVAVSDLKTV